MFDQLYELRGTTWTARLLAMRTDQQTVTTTQAGQYRKRKHNHKKSSQTSTLTGK